MTDILMPKATAVWLIDNSSLTFEQIAEFCRLHPLEVKGIADGDVAAGVLGADPIANGQLTREEIEKAENDHGYHMVATKPNHEEMITRKRKGPRYTPLSRRQERPNAIAWLVRNHPEMSDGQISKLIGTTKTTIQSVRDKTHWNTANIQPQDPVALGLCSQMELDEAVRKAVDKRRKMEAEAGGQPEGDVLAPIAEAARPELAEEEEEAAPGGEIDAASVFANLGGASVSAGEDEAGDGAEEDARPPEGA
ncbi:MAG: DUF1013 domain-containing protein [Caulobacterales bacterium]|nr:DUF1013 domain-containing protein [Caulobacterales bacterium]